MVAFLQAGPMVAGRLPKGRGARRYGGARGQNAGDGHGHDTALHRRFQVGSKSEVDHHPAR